MIAMIRKAIVCKCGCRGWCTFWPILSFTKWSFAALASGTHPHAHFNADAFADFEQFRKGVAGTPLLATALLLYCKGDWMEFCERFGFPSHAHSQRPCFCCSGHGTMMYNPSEVSLLDVPWHENDESDYDAAARECEIVVNLTQEHHRALSGMLQYDKRPHGKHGRTLRFDYLPLGLLADDRLEPSMELQDVGKFEQLTRFPINIIFWRVSRATLVWHRCPLWDRRLGISARRSIALDLLHTYYLGPLLGFAKDGLWCLVDSEIWGRAETTVSEKQLVAIHCMSHEHGQFYKRWEAAHPGESLSRVSTLTPGMLGIGKKRRRLKSKAMEAWGLALFAVEMLGRHMGECGEKGHLLHRAGSLLVEFMRVMKSFGGNLEMHQASQLMDTWKICLSLSNWMCARRSAT